MAYEVGKVDIWVSEMPDRPRGLSKKLETLRTAGANLEFVIARPDKRGKALVFVAPLVGGDQLNAAREAGFEKATSMHTLRISGPNASGLGELMTRAIGDEGLNVRGLSAAAIGEQTITYFRFRNGADMEKAKMALKRALR